MRVVFFLIGFGLMTIGCSYIITYLNLFSFGYTLEEYLKYVLTRYECYYSVIGLLLITITIYYKGEKRNDICL